jgi:TetR/AcrR family transcriptional regulator, tetracycline repressor protein
MALDRETVVRTGLQVLDEVGLEALTLRKIASELNVQPPALYWHFKNKEQLLDEMSTTLLTDGMREFGLPDPSTPWEEFATAYGTGLRQMLLRYRDGAKMFAGKYVTDTRVYELQEAALRIFTAGGFRPTDAAEAVSTIYSYTIGFVIEEQAVWLRPGERNEQYDLEHRAARMDPNEVPLAREAGAVIFSDYGARFERGLQVVVTGLRSWVSQAN